MPSPGNVQDPVSRLQKPSGLSAALQNLVDRDRQPLRSDTSNPQVPHPLPWLTRGVVAIALVKVVAAACAIAAIDVPTATVSAVPPGLIALQLFAFGGAGTLLLCAHGRDSRTAHLGAVLILVASSFATTGFDEFARFAGIGHAIVPLYPDAFLAFYVGRFIQEFPRRPEGSAQFLRIATQLAGFVGLLLFVANALLGWSATQTAVTWLSMAQRRSAGGTVYWTLIFGLMLLMLPLAFAGTRSLAREERRRVHLFWAAFIVGLGPSVLMVVLSSLPGVGPRLTSWVMTGWMVTVLELLLASLPVTVAYAVLVQRLMPARVVIRRALQYLLARWTVTAALLIPTGILILQAYRHRGDTVGSFLVNEGFGLIGLASLAAVALFGRENILVLLDRWFFRDVSNAHAVLLELSEQSRRVHRIEELVALLTAGIDRAFQPESVAVLIRDESGEQFLSLFASVEPLSATSLITELVAESSVALEVSLEDEASPGRWLPRGERQWLVDSRTRLLVPLRASEGGLVGLISIGDRKSELPYSREDRRLLLAIAGAGALTIENHVMRAGSSFVQDWWHVGLMPRQSYAAECAACGRVHPSDVRRCQHCRGELQNAEIPHVLFGKFRFDERVGRGGMGVVYRATDLALERIVAVKTLPNTSPEHSQRLRLEARAMAAVTHRNLAIIHGAESWRGRPMLICEFMTHGTLAARLTDGPLPITTAIDLGIALAEALEVIHDAGLLHRDIKPSNIGFGHAGVPKLLDFGLVHILTKTTERDACPSELAETRGADSGLSNLSVTRSLVGTPLYLSPEAILGNPPTTAFDLWSLNVLLLEAITGQHPFRGRTVEETFDRVRMGNLAESRAAVAKLSPATAAYFDRALAGDLGSRPGSAVQLAEALRVVARQL